MDLLPRHESEGEVATGTSGDIEDAPPHCGGAATSMADGLRDEVRVQRLLPQLAELFLTRALRPRALLS
jgi:hypothetical protein